MCRVARLNTVLVVAVVVSVAAAQTFQYSRGWTNGRKRSGGDVLPVMLTPPRHPQRQPQTSPLSPHPASKSIEDRLRVLEAGLGAFIKANSANFSPGGDDEYYNDN